MRFFNSVLLVSTKLKLLWVDTDVYYNLLLNAPGTFILLTIIVVAIRSTTGYLLLG